MKVIRVNPFDRDTVNEMEIDITPEELRQYEIGKLGLIQHAFPDLLPYEREFIVSGTPPDEWPGVSVDGEPEEDILDEGIEALSDLVVSFVPPSDPRFHAAQRASKGRRIDWLGK